MKTFREFILEYGMGSRRAADNEFSGMGKANVKSLEDLGAITKNSESTPKSLNELLSNVELDNIYESIEETDSSSKEKYFKISFKTNKNAFHVRNPEIVKRFLTNALNNYTITDPNGPSNTVIKLNFGKIRNLKDVANAILTFTFTSTPKTA